MDNIVVTIARQYGSGGKTIGEMYAKEMGIPCYGRNLLQMAADESGISEQLFMQLDEKLRNSPLLRMTTDVYDGKVIPPGQKDFVSAKNQLSGGDHQAACEDGKLCDRRKSGGFCAER